MYIYIYRDRRLGGESNREIVFVSFVRACVRAGEARRGEAVCGRETVCLPGLGCGRAKRALACRGLVVSFRRALLLLCFSRNFLFGSALRTEHLAKSRSEHADVRLTTQCVHSVAQMLQNQGSRRVW